MSDKPNHLDDLCEQDRRIEELIAANAELQQRLDSSLVITPEKTRREDDWKRVKRIMMRPIPTYTYDEIRAICCCFEDSMYEEITLCDRIQKLERVAEAARKAWEHSETMWEGACPVCMEVGAALAALQPAANETPADS